MHSQSHSSPVASHLFAASVHAFTFAPLAPQLRDVYTLDMHESILRMKWFTMFNWYTAVAGLIFMIVAREIEFKCVARGALVVSCVRLVVWSSLSLAGTLSSMT